MAFCAKCGTRLVEGAAFCGVCGTPVGPGAPRTEPPPPPPLPPPPRAYDSYPRAQARPAPDLMTRVVNILTKPKEEWPVIASESATVSSIYSGYIVILAAIPVVASFIGMSLIGSALYFVGGGIGIVAGLVGAVVQYALTLGGAYLAALVIKELAPTFQSQGDMVQALKLVAYSSTAIWIAGILNILPIISILGVLVGGIYSIYLFYLGLPATMKTPPDKVIVYMIVSAVIIFVIYMVIGLIVGAITAASLIGSRIVA